MKKWLIFLVIMGCKVSSFTTKVVPGIDLSRYDTFCYAEYPAKVNITQPEYDNPENRELIDESIKDEMAVWGLEKGRTGNNLLVAYTLSIRDMTDTRIDSAVIYKPWIDLKQDTFSYTEGSFSLVLMDASTGKVIAQSQLQGILDRNPKRFRAAIPRLVKRMFKQIEEEAKITRDR